MAKHIALTRSLILVSNDKKNLLHMLLLMLMEDCLACPFFHVFHIGKHDSASCALSAIVINLSIDIPCWVSLAIWMVAQIVILLMLFVCAANFYFSVVD